MESRRRGRAGGRHRGISGWRPARRSRRCGVGPVVVDRDRAGGLRERRFDVFQIDAVEMIDSGGIGLVFAQGDPAVAGEGSARNPGPVFVVKLEGHPAAFGIVGPSRLPSSPIHPGLLGTQRDGLPKLAVDIKIERRGDATSGWRIRNGTANDDRIGIGDRVAPCHRGPGDRQLHEAAA